MVVMGFVKEDAEMEDAWRKARPMLEKSLKSTPYMTIEELEDDFYHRRRLLWLINDKDDVIAVCMSSVTLSNVLMIEHCGGKNVQQWLPLVWKTFQRYAELANITKMAIVGRKGWLKLLRQYGEIEYRELAIFSSQPEYLTLH